MSDILTDVDIEELATLGEIIVLSLGCDANGQGIPCRSDRFSAVRSMKKYLELHDYVIHDPLDSECSIADVYRRKKGVRDENRN